MRYLSAFLITLFIYLALIITLLVFTRVNTKAQEPIKEKRLSLNYVSIIKEKPLEKPKEVKKKEHKKPEIKKEKVAKHIKKELLKPKQKIKKKIEKKVVEKIVKKKIVRAKEIKKVVKQKPKVVINKKEESPKKPIIKEKLVSNIVKKISYENEFLQKNLLLIKKQIQNHVNYSKRARKMNIQGDVIVEFCITKSGDIINIKTVSGHKLLRKSTIKAIKKAALSFPRVQKDITIKLPIEYRLI